MFDESNVEEVTARFAAYERVLMAGDTDALESFFWPDATRYGTDGNQRSGAEIDAARRRPHAPPDREIHGTLIRSAGADSVIAETEFARRPTGAEGRQTQLWLKRGSEWRVLHAHVSMLPE